MTLSRTKRAKAKLQNRRAHRVVIRDASIAFFHEWAGWGYNPAMETAEQGRQRGAQRLADAEAWAAAQGLVYEWNFDQDGCIGCDCENSDCACSSGEPHEVLYCLLRKSDAGEVLASLHGICQPSTQYRRVIEAELALEAMTKGKE